MRWSEELIPTLREIPKEAEAISHQLMLKAGYVRKLSSGVYSYLPLGFRVLQRVISIIREEMNRAGAIEILMPSLHPAEIWKKTGRYNALGEDKFAFKNRAGQEFVLGPTHEEIVTELAGAYLKSHHQLPKTLYQIQTKFRDEVRPRFGIIRTKEFIMKDAYSFDADEAGLDKSYQKMYAAYQTIFTRLGLAFDIVHADPGIMGGNMSHEFMVRSPYGEDKIVTCQSCKQTLSFDIAGRKISAQPPHSCHPGESRDPELIDSRLKHAGMTEGLNPIERFDTPNLRTIAELEGRFKLKPAEMVKTILYIADESRPVAGCVRGDHEVHEGKLRKAVGAQSLRLASSEEIQKLSGGPVGFTGPVGLANVQIVADADILVMKNFVTGANQKDTHYRGVNYGRDFTASLVADIRYVQSGDLCPACGGGLELVTTMEVGHVFKLGTRYTKSLEANYRTENGEERPLIMGCYGLGVNRIVAAIVEQYHDEKGICWPAAVAPYQVELITINHAEEKTRCCAEEIYEELTKAGISCLYDDRSDRAGVKFNDADLVGVPVHVIVGERNLAQGLVEVKFRQSRKTELVPRQNLLNTLSA